jgi:para-nitrobenzyl esterase
MTLLRTRPAAAFAATAVVWMAMALPGLVLTDPVAADDIAEQPLAIDSGRLAGKQLPSGVRAYLGVPFAAPPVRELRWRPPQPLAAWQGTYHAERAAPECIQSLRAHDINHYFGEEATSEDCLYLNIWAPPREASGPAVPVVVWIYGGGFTIGSASMANYRGESLARKGVVYVALAYRLGALGFLAHPELTAESPQHASGNYGLLDQIAALQWIQRNIASFGGNPRNVTIMGQSAGSMSVSVLQASPLARGLFHRAVGMSGSALGTGIGHPQILSAAEQGGLQLQTTLKVSSLAAMRQLAADRILSAQGATGRYAPLIDGWLLPEDPAAIFAAGKQNDVPILLGYTRNDLNQVALQMRNWSQAQAAAGKAPIYMYLFSRVHPYAPGVTFADHDPATVGAYHTADVPYWLQTLDSLNLFRVTRNWTAYDRDLAERMSDALVNFARTGVATISGVNWPAYRRERERVVELGNTIRVIPLIGSTAEATRSASLRALQATLARTARAAD